MMLAAVVFLLSVDSLTAVVSRTRTRVTPEDISSCVGFMDEVLDKPEVKERAIERAVDHCAVSKRIDDRNYVCVHFSEALKNAFNREDSGEQLLTSTSFCQVTEDYMLTLRGATRIPNVGSGPLINFKIGPNCVNMVRGHMHGKYDVPASQVPDLWYGICMNQDCAHFLPSRTRWCEVKENPTHSFKVCEAARFFMSEAATVMGAARLDSNQVCDVYSDFVEEMGHDVEAYEHVVHRDTSSRVPGLHDKARALQSSRLLNNAGKHFFRDNSGAVVTHSGSYKAPALGLLPAVVMLGALATLIL